MAESLQALMAALGPWSGPLWFAATAAFAAFGACAGVRAWCMVFGHPIPREHSERIPVRRMSTSFPDRADPDVIEAESRG